MRPEREAQAAIIMNLKDAQRGVPPYEGFGECLHNMIEHLK